MASRGDAMAAGWGRVRGRPRAARALGGAGPATGAPATAGPWLSPVPRLAPGSPSPGGRPGDRC